jgi:apolipoprotein N-acyltransferase
MDFPHLIRQAGAGRTDLLLAPSNDWKEIKEIHRAMAVFRAIENGVSLVRATSTGLSTAVDPVGRVYGLGDDRAPNGRVMVATLPIGGVRTIYSRIGDFFGWLCVAAFGVVIAVALL